MDSFTTPFTANRAHWVHMNKPLFRPTDGINTTISAVGPYVAGHLYDIGYPYSGTCYFIAAWSFLGALILVIIRRPHPQPSTVPA